MEIEGERVSSSQNERTLRGEGVLENEQGPTGEWGGGGGGRESGVAVCCVGASKLGNS